MLRNRLVSAFIVISCALVFVALEAWAPNANCNGIWMLPLAAYLIFGSAIECVAMVRNSPLGSITAPALLGCGGIMLAACIPILWPLFTGEAYSADCLLGRLGWPLAAGAISLVACFVWMLPSYQPQSGSFLRAILAGWVSVYFGSCFAFATALLALGSRSWALFLFVGIIVVTKSADAGAYFSGRAFGRHKLCPNVSPGKTVEGLLGGMLVATLAAWVYYSIGAPLAFGGSRVLIHGLAPILLGVALTLAGVAGDLLESVFKRELGCKDSGNLLPGLGGLWDVTDSLLPASVVGYIMIMVGLLEGPV